jgi:C1A family cysteine protease
MLRTLHHADGTTRQIHLGGWRKQSTDPRDAEYSLKLHGSFLGTLPTSVDQRPICSSIEDQGDLGSCTANMFAGLIESNEIRRNAHAVHPSFAHLAIGSAQVSVSNITVALDGAISYLTTVRPPAPAPTPIPPAPPAPPVPQKLIHVSRLFEYYATRKIEGTVSEDSGASIRDAIKSGVIYGVADESTWPYDISKFTINPPSGIWTAAAAHRVTSYHSVTDGDIQTMKSVLASGYLIGFGFQVYDYMMSAQMAKTGFLLLPGPNEQLQGGHAVCLVGYDDSKKAFLVRNSWGIGWGIAGYFWMAYDYVKNTALSSDFWVVQSAPV